MAQEFSVEIIERIVDFLWYDPYSLSQCSLVSKAWLPRCQYHFRHMFHAADRAAIDRLVTLLLSEVYRHKSNLSYPITLRIAEDKRAPYTHNFPVIFARQLPILTFLDIVDADWSISLPHPVFYRSIGQARALTHLSLTRCRFHQFAHFVRVIEGLPDLRDLRMRRVEFIRAYVGAKQYHLNASEEDQGAHSDDSDLDSERDSASEDSSDDDEMRSDASSRESLDSFQMGKRPYLRCMIAHDFLERDIRPLLAWLRASPSVGTITIFELTNNKRELISWEIPFLYLIKRMAVQLEHLGHSDVSGSTMSRLRRLRIKSHVAYKRNSETFLGARTLLCNSLIVTARITSRPGVRTMRSKCSLFPDGRHCWMASTSPHRSIAVYNTLSGQAVLTIPNSLEAVPSPDGRLLVSLPVRGHGSITVWDLSSRQIVVTLDGSSPILEVLWSANARYLVLHDAREGLVTIFDVKSESDMRMLDLRGAFPSCSQRISIQHPWASISDDAGIIAIACLDCSAIHMYDAQHDTSGSIDMGASNTSEDSPVLLSHDGSLLITWNRSGGISISEVDLVSVTKEKRQKNRRNQPSRLVARPTETSQITSMALSTDGQFLAVLRKRPDEVSILASRTGRLLCKTLLDASYKSVSFAPPEHREIFRLSLMRNRSCVVYTLRNFESEITAEIAKPIVFDVNTATYANET